MKRGIRIIENFKIVYIVDDDDDDIFMCEIYNDIYCFDLLESFTGETDSEAEIEAINSLHSFEKDRTNEEIERDNLVAKRVTDILNPNYAIAKN